MSDSTLDPDNIPAGNDRTLGRGHGTRALGPSDSSDSGSDVAAGSPLAQEDDLGLERGTNEDTGGVGPTAGPALGDADLDSDTDAGGTGERGEVGRGSVEAGADIGFDHVEAMPLVDGEFKDAVPGDDEEDGDGDGDVGTASEEERRERMVQPGGPSSPPPLHR